ncbi:hypothetical protein L6164_001109 [Bauhinia variegata]|uniref:Uncharacterized protein n=1 Tax=Bauhinia variegata TaxID=167791 RepID=A0ACB9Q8N8_BAUVA|nr:hypothetical protein L6164_001109 [Bauhinia variegata]
MLNWPELVNLKQLRGFLGLTGFYKKIVEKYASIAAPLTELLKKDSFIWTNAATQAFESLKQEMTIAPMLALPNFTQPFTLETDASSQGMGALLLQQRLPTAYFSKSLYPEDSTRENKEELKTAYPNLHLEDKVFLQEEGDDMSASMIRQGYASILEEADMKTHEPISEVRGVGPRTRAKRNTLRPK